MSLNNENSGSLVLDLETAPIDDAAHYIEPVSAPANYKDAEKIAAFCQERQRELVDRAALDPDLCRIVAAGLMGEDGELRVLTASDRIEEAYLLTQLWRAVGDKLIVGFNVCAFDLPVLLRRSLYLEVLAPKILISKYKHPRVVDLQLELSFDGAMKMHGLSFYCKRFGLDVPDDPTTGAEIPGLIAAGEWAKVRHHVETDVRKTAALAQRIGLFHPQTAMVL